METPAGLSAPGCSGTWLPTVSQHTSSILSALTDPFMSPKQFILNRVLPGHNAAERADDDLRNLGYAAPTARNWVGHPGVLVRTTWPRVHC